MRPIHGRKLCKVVHVFLMQMGSRGGTILIFTYKSQIRKMCIFERKKKLNRNSTEKLKQSNIEYI